MALCQGGGQVGWWRQVKPGTDERWHFLKTVSMRQKSVVSTERFLCAGVLFSGVLLCISFPPALMSPCFSSMLKWCKCVERPPEPCPGWGTGTAQEVWERGSLLSFASQQCRKLLLWMDSCPHFKMGLFGAEVLQSLFPDRVVVGAAGFSSGWPWGLGYQREPRVLLSSHHTDFGDRPWSASSSSSSLLFLKRLLKAAAFLHLLPSKHGGRVCTSGVCHGAVSAVING